MTTTPTCPDEPTLAALLAGRLPAGQADLYEPHLAHCGQCLAKAEQLGVEDDLVDALRDTDVGEETTSLHDEPLVDDLVARLSGLNEPASFRDMLTEDELRSILGPAMREDELGRLGKHRVTEVLGAGGMGVVFKAEDTELGRTVAIKVMKPQLAASRDSCRRFRREACAIAAFEHSHVVTVYHVGEEQGVPYFSMQLLEGESLRRRIDREGKLPPREVLRIGREIAAGLQAAHARGLLHRDIKPDNVWLEADGDHVRIVDFGLARAVDQSSSLSQSGAILGTPRYMAPEQIRGDGVDERCDLFSLGSLLFHAATGAPAFAGNNLVATLVSVSQDEVAPPHQDHPELPRELSDLILKLLEKDPDRRIQTAAEVVEQIERIENDPQGLSLAGRPPKSARALFWGLAAANSLLLLAGTLIYIAFDRGTLVIDADESVAVTIEQGSVLLRDRASGREYDISIGENPVRAGIYEIFALDKDAGLQFSSNELSISRGEKRVVTISLRPDPAPGGPAPSDSAPGDSTDAVTRNRPAAPAQPRAPPAWLSDTEDSLGIQAADPLSKRSLVTKPAAVTDITSWTVEPTHHRSAVNDVAFSSDATLVATGSQDGTLRIWDAKTRQLRQIIVCPGSVRHVAWSGDGHYLASAQGRTGTGSICIWELTGGGARLIKKINRSTTQLAWSPDSSLLAFQDSSVQFWELKSGEILPNRGVQGSISRRPWSADGARLATTADEGVLLWDAADLKQLGSFAHPGNQDAIWSRSGSYIATFYISRPSPERRNSQRPCYVEVWDVTKRQRIKRFSVGHASSTAELSWSPDESVVATHLEGTISLWDLKHGQKQKELPQPQQRSSRRIRSARLAWAAVGNRLATLVGGQVELWDPETDERLPLTGNNEHVRFNNHALHSRRQLLATTVGYEAARSALWDLKTLRPLLRIDEEGWEFSLSPNGRRLAAWKSKSLSRSDTPVDLEVRFYDLPEAKQTGSIEVRLSRLPLGQWSPDSRLLALYCEHHPHAVVLDGTKLLHTLGKLQPRADRNPIDRAERIAWSPDSKFIAWNRDYQVCAVTEIETGEMVATLTVEAGERGNRRGLSVVWSPDGQRIARSFADHNPNSKLAMWELPVPLAGSLMQPTTVWDVASATQVAFSPNGQYIAALDSATLVRVWDTGSGAQTASIPLPLASESGLEWFADSRHLGFAGTDAAGVVDLETQKVKFRSHDTEYFVPTCQDGNVLAVGWSNQVTFYDQQLTSAATLVVPTNPDESLLAVHSDGSFRSGDSSVGSADAAGYGPRIVALREGVQRTYSPDDFSRQYGWRNEPKPLLPENEQETNSLDIVVGDPLSPLALVQDPATLPGVQSWTVETRDHRAAVHALSFSPAGERVATVASDGTVRIWDADSGDLQRLIVCPGIVGSIAWSPDGTAIATSQVPAEDRSQGTICVWDVAESVKLIRKIDEPAYSLSWSPDGKTLAGWYGGKIWLWQGSSRRALTTNEAEGLASKNPWSPDGRKIAIANGGGLEIWETGRVKLVKAISVDKCAHVSWMADGKSIACVRVGLFNEDGDNVNVHRIEFWDIESGERTEAMTVARAPANTTRVDNFLFALSPDESTIATVIDWRVELWDRKTGERIAESLVDQPPTAEHMVGLSWSPDSGRLAYLDAGEAHIWDAKTRSTARLCGQRGGIVVKQSITTEDSNLLLTESLDGQQHTLWNLTTAEAVFAAEGKAWQISLSPTGETIALMRPDQTADNPAIAVEIQLHEVGGDREERTLSLSVPFATQLIWAPNGKQFALVNASSGAVPMGPLEPPGRRSVRRVQGGFVTVAGINGSVLLEQRGDLTPTQQGWPNYSSKALFDKRRAAWSPDSTRIAWWKSQGTVAVTDVATGADVHLLQAPGQRVDPNRRPREASSVDAIAWSGDGQRLAWLEGKSNRSGRWVMWQLSGELPELVANVSMSDWRPGSNNHVAFSADSKYAFTTIGSPRLDIWEVAGARKLSTIDEPRSNWAAWLSDAPRIAVLQAGWLELATPADPTAEYKPVRLARDVQGISIAANDSIVYSSGRQIRVHGADLSRQAIWIYTPEQSIIGVYSDGRIVSSADAEPIRFVVFADNEQRLLTRDEFAKLSGLEPSQLAPPR